MAQRRAMLVFVVLALCCLDAVEVDASGSNHKYATGDPVPLYANKVGPFHNPSETYKYFDLPFCHPVGEVTEKREALGEVLNGDRMVEALYELRFRVDKEMKTLCEKTLTKDDIKKFQDAVKNDYFFEMYYDDLPIWGYVGKKEDSGQDVKYFLYTHVHFEILYNQDRVIEINVGFDPMYTVDITESKEQTVKFTYSAKWKVTDKLFSQRMEKYSKSSFMPQHLEIHWFSIINSCVTVLLLTGFLATILMRVLKNDFIKYSRDEEAADEQEETGWKYIHGDVFRFPPYKSLFCAVLGSGAQLLALAIFIFMLALVGVFYPYNRGALYTALVMIYALTSGIAGYTAASFYKQLEGVNWVRNILYTGGLFCGPLFLTFSFLNTVAIFYNATAALPFGTICVIFLIWTLITAPLLVLGGIAGKNSKAEFQAPTRTTKFPREIPPLPWYRYTVPQMAMAGFLPFSAIYIELYYIFASVWGHKVYTIYSILFIVFIILIIVTAFITIALTYFQLAVEDHEWWWRAVLCGGSTGVFIYGYCFYYYYARSDMHDGSAAALYAKENLLSFILQNALFPTSVEEAVKEEFLRLDRDFLEACQQDHNLHSGTTALIALLQSRNLLVANAGDCRAVLCRRGKTVPLSSDHAPNSEGERMRIELAGGTVTSDGYVNGQVTVTRAIGDWHMQGVKGLNDTGPVIAEPEIKTLELSEDDEFLLLGCDGLWEVFTSSAAIDFARRQLREHNDPEKCSKALVEEALKRNAQDNITVITVCFQAEAPPDVTVVETRSTTRKVNLESMLSLQQDLDIAEASNAYRRIDC